MNKLISLTVSVLIFVLLLSTAGGSEMFPPLEKHAVLPHTEFSQSEMRAFLRALQIFDPANRYPTQDANIYGNIHLGTTEADFKSRHLDVKPYFSEPKFFFRSYVQQSTGFVYQFWSGHLFKLDASISTFANSEAGLAAAQKRFLEYSARARGLFGDSSTKLSGRDRDYQSNVWVLSRDDQGCALIVGVTCPRRVSEKTSRFGVAAEVDIFDKDTNDALGRVGREMGYRALPGTDQRLQHLVEPDAPGIYHQ